MSWLSGASAERRDVLALRPELADAHEALHAAVWASGVPAETLELCRLRMAQLLDARRAMAERSPQAAGLDDARVAALGRWPSATCFTDAERACLGFAELFVLDHHSITDEQAAAVVAALGEPGFVAFTTALSVWENQHRFDIALGVT
jgi:alkylhydroperoxidase family enzyme